MSLSGRQPQAQAQHAAPPERWRRALTLSLNTNDMASTPPGTEVRTVSCTRGGGTKLFIASDDLLDAED